MNQAERRKYLIGALLKENRKYERMQIPKDVNEQKQLLRSLMNVRFAAPITEEYTAVQDEYLQDVNTEKGFITLSDMEELQPDLSSGREILRASRSVRLSMLPTAA